MDNLLNGLNLNNLAGFAAPKPLVEFKAGKMTYDGKMVKPDRRRGIIRVIQDPQGMKQFQWLDADTKNPIDSFYVFPDDIKFEKVKQSKDRVYLLEFKSTQQRNFYWIQEQDKTKDEELSKKVHNLLNNITAENTVPAATGPALVNQTQ